MRAEPFLDTNVLVYAFTVHDDRRQRAASLIEEGGVVSVQVLNEFVDVSRRKFRRDWDEITRALDDLAAFLERPIPLTVDVHRGAVDISRRHGFRIYDSLILAAARLAGCRTLYTEDLQDGQTIEGVLVHNPFRDA